jgi:hypothetical protein
VDARDESDLASVLTPLWDALDHRLKTRAVILLQQELSEEEKEKARELIREHGRVEWLTAAFLHHGWGMQVRNLLRTRIKDEELPPGTAGEHGNWDDYYGHAVECAVGERTL